MAHLVPVDEVPPVSILRRREGADTEWHSLLEDALTRPRKWWRVEPEYATPNAAASAAFDITTGRKVNFPAGRWEAKARNCHVFIRYMGK